jgi:hypothetical protein
MNNCLIELEDDAEQELEEEDYLTSASVTESTAMSDAVPSHARKRTLDEVDGDEGLEYADEAYASEDADVISSNGADNYGDSAFRVKPVQESVRLIVANKTWTPQTAASLY